MNSSPGNRAPFQGQATRDAGLDLFEANTHPFVVKIWLEEMDEETNQAVWRGHITHVVSGRRQYFTDLDEISAFIRPYLEEMGVRFQGEEVTHAR